MRKFIVWSYCTDEPQTFVDVVKARSPKDANAKVRRSRPYLDFLEEDATMLLTEYIKHLQKAQLEED